MVFNIYWFLLYVNSVSSLQLTVSFLCLNYDVLSKMLQAKIKCIEIPSEIVTLIIIFFIVLLLFVLMIALQKC